MMSEVSQQFDESGVLSFGLSPEKLAEQGE